MNDEELIKWFNGLRNTEKKMVYVLYLNFVERKHDEKLEKELMEQADKELYEAIDEFGKLGNYY